jgi:predicted nucleotidyltransferase
MLCRKGEPVTSKDVLQVLSQHKPEIQQRFAVADLAIFGSVARDESQAGSDLDVLATFQNRADFDRFMVSSSTWKICSESLSIL